MKNLSDKMKKKSEKSEYQKTLEWLNNIKCYSSTKENVKKKGIIIDEDCFKEDKD